MARPITNKITVSEWRQKRKNGDIYVWERRTQWDHEKRMTVEKSRKLLGKIPADSETQEMVPTRPKRPSVKKQEATGEQHYSRQRVGATVLLNWIGRESGITRDLSVCADEGTAQKIETIAQFWLANQGDRLTRMEKWQWQHECPYPGVMGKKTHHELFVRLGGDENLMQNYFRARSARCRRESGLALDSTTISSYSTGIKEARQGFNKAGDGLDTVKLVTLYDLETNQPVAFARQPGNLADVAGISDAVAQLRTLEFEKLQLVTDKGYYSQGNISELCRGHYKFLTAAPLGLQWINRQLQEHRQELETASSAHPDDLNTHGITVPVVAEFKTTRRRTRNGIAKGEEETFTRRLYLHLYQNKARVVDEEKALLSDLMQLKGLVERGTEDLSDAARRRAGKFLVVSSRGRGGKLKVSVNEEAYAEAVKDLGYFALVSNKAEDCHEALRKYRLREKIEEAFKDTKNRIDGHRTRVWDGDTLYGRLFCQFVALGYYCFFRSKLTKLKQRLKLECSDQGGLTEGERKERENLLGWLESRSMQSILDWLDCIELRTVQAGDQLSHNRTGETARDRLFFRLLGIPGFEEKPKGTMKA